MIPYIRASIDLSTIHPKLNGSLTLLSDGTWVWWIWHDFGHRITSGGNRRPRKAVHPLNLHPRSPSKHFA